jgi:hypothetical protein
MITMLAVSAKLTISPLAATCAISGACATFCRRSVAAPAATAGRTSQTPAASAKARWHADPSTRAMAA